MPRSRWKYRRTGGRHCLPHALIQRGTIPSQRYRCAEGFAAARRPDPALLALAWAVQIIELARPLGLDSAAVRSRIVATDHPLLRLGFAGIHFDLGPVPSGDQVYLDLLSAPPRTGVAHLACQLS